VISLAPSITRIIGALDGKQSLIAIDEFSRGIEGFEQLPSVGGLFSPDLERTVELRPTLVLAVRSAQQGGYIAQLRARGVRVEELSGHRLEEVIESYARIGELIGREAQARALVARVRTELAAVEAAAGDLPRRRVALVIERDPLYVVGAGSFAHALIAMAGGANVFSELHEPYPRVALEALADRRPDVLIDSTAEPSASVDAAGSARRYWGRFNWVGRVEALPSGLATLPGPDLADGARALLARIHPEQARAALP
jgi:ABC-type Fe3+-hydroxamate transport system substrate-binding protein